MTYHPNAISKDGQKLARLIEVSTKLTGQFRVAVVQDGKEVSALPWRPNLILDSGLDNAASRNWIDMLFAGVAGTGTTATKDTLDGTWSQTGTTVSSSGSTYTLTSGDVGKWISWASGEQAKITALINGTSVTVSKSQTVVAGAANLYRADQTGLASESKRSTTYAAFTMPDGSHSRGIILDEAAQKITLRETFDFSAEVGAVNYTEIGVSHTASVAANLFSRILLSGAVSVGIGQQLRVTYSLVLQMANIVTRPTYTMAVTGWPVSYAISSITSNGTSWTITTTIAHHYVSGGKVNIAGALAPKTAVTAASSTSIDFTITTGASHGKSPGDSVVFEDMTPSAYNGTFTCAAGTTGTTIVVASVLNPGTGTAFGTVRLETPGTWYDGEHTCASGTTGSTIVITNATVITAAGASGTVYNNTKMKYEPWFWGVAQRLTSGSGFVNTSTYLYPSTTGANIRGFMDPLSNIAVHGYNNGAKTAPTFASGASGFSGNVDPSSVSEPSYVNGNHYKDSITTFDPGIFNLGTIRSLCLLACNSTANAISQSANSGGQMLLNFEEPQLKTSTYRLAITIRRSWTRTFA